MPALFATLRAMASVRRGKIARDLEGDGVAETGTCVHLKVLSKLMCGESSKRCLES
jgi:hypothetical protein